MSGWLLQYRAQHTVSIYKHTDVHEVTRYWPVCTCRWNDNLTKGTKTFESADEAIEHARQQHAFGDDIGITTMQREWYG